MGWSWGYVATVDREGRTIFVVDVHHTERLKDEIKAKLALSPVVADLLPLRKGNE